MCGLTPPAPIWCKVFLDIMTRFRQGYKSTHFFFFVWQGICKECKSVRVERKSLEKDDCDCHISNRLKPQGLCFEAAS